MDKNQNISQYLKESATAVLDHGINLITDDEVIKEIPLIKYVASINSITDAFFAKRLHRNAIYFLDRIKNTKEEIELDECSNEEFIDTLSLILIEGEKPIKAKIVGNLTKAYAQRQFNFTTLNHLCLIVHSASVPALNSLALLATEELLAKIDDIDSTHNSAKTFGIAPNISILLRGPGVTTPFLIAMGVATPDNRLNGYGMALLKYGNMRELEKHRMDIFRSSK